VLRTQIEDDRAGNQLQAGYRECDLGLDRCLAVTDEPKRRREPAARLVRMHREIWRDLARRRQLENDGTSALDFETRQQG
jgi:hypothetical protein